MARSRVAFEEVPAAPPRPARRERRKTDVRIAPVVTTTEREYHQTIRRVAVWSVLKVSVCFYFSALVVTLGSGIILWYAATTMGLIDNVESLVRSLFGVKEFTLLAWRLLRAATLIGLVVTCLAIVMTTLAAAFYNLFSTIIGGVEVTVVEDDASAR